MRINPESLIGTKNMPSHYGLIRSLSRTARAYHSLQPYPSYSNMTKNWKIEERGPFPRCRPFVQNIVNKGATWLFGKPITFRVAEEAKEKPEPGKKPKGKYDELNEKINKAWADNDMQSMSRVSAIIGANSGGVFVKFSYDETKDKPIQIDVLDPAEQVRLFWDPDNIDELLMARIQYPYYDAVKGQTYWMREDYTDQTHVTYKPIEMSVITGIGVFNDPYQAVDQIDGWDKWEEESREANPFGIIPGWYIRNRKNGTEYGEGDLWTMFDTIDQINFTRNLAHLDNQNSIDPTRAYIDLDAADGDQPGTGENKVEVLQSKAGDGTDKKQGKIQVIESNAAMRDPLDSFASELIRELYNAVGSVDLDPEDVTNKGNLTSAVMIQMYAPLVERTGEKRQCYGEDGYCVLFERMAKGLSTLGVEGWEPVEDIQVVWPPYFEETEDEKTLLANRQAMLVESNLTTHEMAVREIANSDGIQDIDAHLSDVLMQKKDAEEKEQKQMEMENSQMNRQRAGMLPK